MTPSQQDPFSCRVIVEIVVPIVGSFLTVPGASARLALVLLTRKWVSSPLHHSAPFFASRVPPLVYCFRLRSHHKNRIRRHVAETPAKLNRILRTSCRHLQMQRLAAGGHGMSGLSLVMLHSMGINSPYVCFITMSFDQETKPMVSMLFAAEVGAAHLVSDQVLHQLDSDHTKFVICLFGHFLGCSLDCILNK